MKAIGPKQALNFPTPKQSRNLPASSSMFTLNVKNSYLKTPTFLLYILLRSCERYGKTIIP